MDPITHLLAGATLAHAGAKRPASPVLLTLLAGALLPDFDYLAVVGGAGAFLTHHRTWSHSLVGGIFWGGAAAAAVWYLYTRRHSGQRPRLRTLLLAGWAGAASHLFLDWMTSSGVAWFWPGRSATYRLDWFPFTDLWLVAILALGLAVPALLRLVAEEIGARRSSAGLRRGAWVALIVFALFTVLRASTHDRALRQLDLRLYAGRTALRAAAAPAPMNPWRWHGLVETDATLEVITLHLLNPVVSPRDHSTFYKPEESLMLEAALATRSAERFLRRARFPHAEVIPSSGGWRVRLRDLAENPGQRQGQRMLVLVELDSTLEVVSEQIIFGDPEGTPSG